MAIVDAIRATEHDARVKLPGKTQSWTVVLVVGFERRGAVATVGSIASELKNAGGACDGVGGRRVQEGEAVLSLAEGRHDIPAQADVHGQLGGYLPVVIGIQGKGTVAGAGFLCNRRVLRVAARVHGTEQVACVGKASAGLRRCRRAAHLRRFVQTEVQRCQGAAGVGIEVVVLHPLNLAAEGEGVTPLDPLHVVEQRKGIGIADVAGSAVPTGRRFAGRRRTSRKESCPKPGRWEGW